MNPRALRLLRGIAVTATSVVVTSIAHMVAGGDAPGPIGVATALVVGIVLGTALLGGRGVTPLRTALTIAGGQLVFHAVFSWGASVTAWSEHVHGAPLSMNAVPAHEASSMVFAHIVAGVLALGILLFEQRLLDQLVATARRALAQLGVPDTVPVPLPRVPRVIAGFDWSMPTSAGHRSLVPRRGPPAELLPA